MSKMDEAIRVLIDAGYEPAGETPTEITKIITAESYPLAGGIAKSGGRLRFEKSPYRATVGRRTVCLYEMVDGKPANHQNIQTSEFCRDDVEVYPYRGLLADAEPEQETVTYE